MYEGITKQPKIYTHTNSTQNKRKLNGLITQKYYCIVDDLCSLFIWNSPVTGDNSNGGGSIIKTATIKAEQKQLAIAWVACFQTCIHSVFIRIVTKYLSFVRLDSHMHTHNTIFCWILSQFLALSLYPLPLSRSLYFFHSSECNCLYIYFLYSVVVYLLDASKTGERASEYVCARVRIRFQYDIKISL